MRSSSPPPSGSSTASLTSQPAASLPDDEATDDWRSPRILHAQPNGSSTSGHRSNEWAAISTVEASTPNADQFGASTNPLAATELAASPATNAREGRYIQQYELIRELGRGGMGVVHLARDLRLGRLVAIKMLTKANHHQERFLAEARATARCRHENIVVIHDVGMHSEQPYLVFEYLRGQTLRQWMETRAGAAFESSGSFGETAVPLAPTRAVEMIVPVVRALVCAHDMGIIHRDLKPANILLTDEGVTKVLDFGVAKIGAMRDDIRIEDAAVSGEPLALTALGVRLGTLPYMSPEQLAGEVVDHRSDIWAVGIILYELVTGAHPLAPLSLAKIHLVADVDTPMPNVREHRSDLGPLADIISRCLLKHREHRTATARELLQEFEALLPVQRMRAHDKDGNPFAGLAAFQEPDADRFFGRDHEIGQIATEVRSRPLVAVVGPSGTGKSSLVRAGVIPALKRSGEGWDAHVVRPGREPLGALAAMVGAFALRHGSSHELGHSDDGAAGSAQEDSAAGAVLGPIIERLRAESGYLAARLRARATSKLRRVLVFVDQLEELYTLGAPAEDRTTFLACLAAMADDDASPLRVLVTMRSDFLDRLAEDRRLGTEVSRGLVLLPPMDRGRMREALLRPVEASEYRFEPHALVDRMVDALAATRGALPLLQFTAARLWERRDRERRLLTEASYEQLGGVAGALATHADAVLAGMAPAQQAVARTVLERLVTPERTRALVNMAELYALHREPVLVDEIVQHLAAVRLVVIERGAEGTERTVELVHESLIDRWPTLVRWLAESQDDAAMRARLRIAARDWERGGRATGLLWTGEAADEARAWQQRYQGELAPAERSFLDAVLAAAERTRRGRRQLFGGILLAAVVVAMTMAWLAWQQAQGTTLARQEAKAHQAAAEAATAVAQEAAREAARARDATRMAALRTIPKDPIAQLALVREIEDTSSPPPGAVQEAKRLLHASIAPMVLTGHNDMVISVAFSPDGQRIVSGSSDRTVRVWNADGSGEPLILRGHGDQVLSVAFSPDGRRIVSGSNDRTVRVWNADGSGEPLVLHEHRGPVLSVEFSPDGQGIVSASWDQSIQVWNIDGSDEPLVLHGHDDEVWSAAFSPSGQRIVSAAKDKTVRVWNADGSGEPLVLRGHDDRVWSAAFSPDSRRIVSASSDRTVRIWSADGRGKPLILRGHDDVVMSAAFSPDGQHIVSASWDKTVRVWNADGSGEPLVLRGHDDQVWSAGFSPDGRRIVSASWDKTARVWNTDGTGEPLVLSDHEPTPVTLDDPRLWTATSYCMPIERRIELLGVTQNQAERDDRRCLERVEQARRGESARP